MAADPKRSERTAITADYVLQGIREVAERCMQRAAVMVGRGGHVKQGGDLASKSSTSAPVP
ncbi:hypothetical protein WBP07_09005 [Novosphingobium sp. BL-8A]|uniref:hypothetical protein n=1 Tax=Novosphingobium sp. BL-8A TaxID=3127639 RepID=UPI0037564D87